MSSINAVKTALPDRCCANKGSAMSASFMHPAPAAHKTVRMQFTARCDAVNLNAVSRSSEAKILNLNGSETIDAQLKRLDGRVVRQNKSIAPYIVEKQQAEEPQGFWANVKAAFSSPTVLHGISGGDIYVRDQAHSISASVPLPKEAPKAFLSSVTTINGVPVEWNKRINTSHYIQKPDPVLNKMVVQGNVPRQTVIMNAYQTSM